MGISEKAAYLNGLFDGYEIDKNTKGIIGIVAPTRMDYAKACAHLAAFKLAVRQLAPRQGQEAIVIRQIGERNEEGTN